MPSLGRLQSSMLPVPLQGRQSTLLRALMIHWQGDFFFLWNDGNDGDMCGRWEHVAPSLFHLIFRKRAEVAQESGEMQGTSLWAALFSPSVQ